MITRFARLLHREEDGATAVLFALLLPVLLAMIGFGAEVVAMAGAERELQRTGDQAVLAGAAQIPLADLSALSGAASQAQVVASLLPPAPQPVADACAVADTNAQSSPLLTGFAAAVPSCQNGGVALSGQLTSPNAISEVQQLLADGVAGPLAAIGGGTPVGQLTQMGLLGLPVDPLALLPAIATPRIRAVTSADVSTPLRSLIVPDTGERPTTPLSTTSVARRRFKNALLLPVLDAPGCQPGAVSVGTGPFLDTLRALVGDEPTATFLHDQGLLDLTQLQGLLNGLLGQDAVDAILDLPPPLPLDLLIPVVEPPPPPTATAGEILGAIGLSGIIDTVGVDAVLGTIAPSATLTVDGDGAAVVAPGTNASVTAEVDALLGATGLLGTLAAGCRVDLNRRLTPALVAQLDDVLTALIARLRVLAVTVPGLDHLANALEDIRIDLVDLLDPSDGAPLMTDVLAAAANADEDVLVVVIGSTQIPALDFLVQPARDVEALVDTAGTLDVPATVAASGNLLSSATTARGLFRATLVD